MAFSATSKSQMKRTHEAGSSQSKATKPANEYRGATTKSYCEIETVSDFAQFKERYIDSRKPVKISGPLPFELAKFRLENIVQTLNYDEPLQVERKHGHGFGSGRAREHMSLAEIVEKIQSGDDSYYLTTQYEEGEGDDEKEDEEEDDEDEESEAAFGEENGVGESEDDENEENESEKDSEPESQEQGESASDNVTFPPGKTELENALRSQVPAAASAFSDSDDSIDFSNLHDDFEEDEDDFDENDDESDAAFRIRSLFQPPLTNLAKNAQFPISPPPFQDLVTQQINLWLGTHKTAASPPDFSSPESLGRYVPSGNSSGLHHDHADNLYVLVSGRKRFTLYSPDCAQQLHTVGNINRVYANGLVDYCVDANARFWRPMREDGAILAEWAKWALASGQSAMSPAKLQELIDYEPRHRGPSDASIDPPSFSQVPPVFAHLDEVSDSKAQASLRAFADERYPGFLTLPKLEVWLEPGDMLFIPTGWFHEVTSFGNDDQAHIAVNWWFVPPSRHGSAVYEDDYWAADFADTLLAVQSSRTPR